MSYQQEVLQKRYEEFRDSVGGWKKMREVLKGYLRFEFMHNIPLKIHYNPNSNENHSPKEWTKEFERHLITALEVDSALKEMQNHFPKGHKILFEHIIKFGDMNIICQEMNIAEISTGYRMEARALRQLFNRLVLGVKEDN